MTELWASKRPDLMWCPADPNRHSPSLESVAGGLCWFFRVDEVFAAWMCRTIRKARTANAELSSDALEAYRRAREYLEDKTPGCWTAVERAAAGPVVLPGSEIIERAAVLARFGLGPRWEGWEKHVPKTDDATPPTPPKPTAAAAKTRTRSPGMF